MMKRPGHTLAVIVWSQLLVFPYATGICSGRTDDPPRPPDNSPGRTAVQGSAVGARRGVGCRHVSGGVSSSPERKKEAAVDAPLSKRLGPSAKKLYLRSDRDLKVTTLVQVAPSID